MRIFASGVSICARLILRRTTYLSISVYAQLIFNGFCLLLCMREGMVSVILRHLIHFLKGTMHCELSLRLRSLQRHSITGR